MIIQEQWTHWAQAQSFEDKYFIDFITFKPCKLIITLKKKNKIMHFVFNSEIIHYKRNDEAFCVNLCLLLSNYNVDFAEKTFFKVINSSYAQTLETSVPNSFSKSLHHFCLLADDSVVDILATHEPEIIFSLRMDSDAQGGYEV